MNGDQRTIKKIKGKAGKKEQGDDQQQEKKAKRVTFGDFEEEEKVITSKKKNESSHSKRENIIEKHNAHQEEENQENLEFEDEFDDEWEEEVNHEPDEEEAKMNASEDEEGYDEEELTKHFGEMKFSETPVIREYDDRGKKKKKGDENLKAFIGTAKSLKEGEVLEFDNRAYDMFHRANTEWPCLTLDILIPEHNRQEIIKPSSVKVEEYPLSVHVVAGTQASQANDNAIYFMKWFQLHKTRFDDESQVMDDMDEDDEPSFNVLPIKHPHAINRIRSMNGSSVVALWDDAGNVSIYDGTKHTQALAEYDDETSEITDGAKGGLKAPKDSNKKNFLLSSFQHSAEGYALGWSPHTLGLLATGSCDKKIYFYALADENGSSWVMDNTPFTVHKESVEDLQFSPDNANLLASCSVDGTIKFIDIRTENRKKAEATIKVSDTDVNVLSWSTFAPNLIAAGSDDGTIQVWDIRYINKARSVAEIQFHQDPITSIEFQPYEDSVLTVASADNRITIWDFSVEADVKSKDEEIPDQLMFIHQGLEDVKEVRHHPYMSEIILSTAANGFNIFKPNYDENDWEDDN